MNNRTACSLVFMLSLGVGAAPARAADAPATKSYEVETIKDVAYYTGTGADKDKHKLDLFLPKGKKSFPVLLFVHGGAWVFGDKNDFGIYSRLGRHLAEQGIGAVVTSYRLSPKVQHPEHIKDVARAFAWTHRNIAQHGGDADKIFVAGHSAGGHLASLLVTDETYLKAEGLATRNIKGAIPLSGVYVIPDNMFENVFGKDAEVHKQASPITHVRTGLPPFLIVYAESDFPLCDVTSKSFSEKLKAKKCDAETLEIKKTNHISIITNLCQGGRDPAFRAIVTFVGKHSEQ